MAGRAGGEAKASKSKQTLAESSRIFAPLPPVPSPLPSIPNPKGNILKGLKEVQKRISWGLETGFGMFIPVIRDLSDSWKQLD